MSKYAAAIWPGNGNILKLPTFKWQGQVTRLAIQNIVPFILSIQNFKWYHHSISSNRSPSGIWWELTLIYIYTVYPVSHAKRDYIMYIFPKNLRTNNINNSKYKNHIPNHHISPCWIFPSTKMSSSDLEGIGKQSHNYGFAYIQKKHWESCHRKIQLISYEKTWVFTPKYPVVQAHVPRKIIQTPNPKTIPNQP